MSEPEPTPATLIDRLAQEFLDRFRCGERPLISNYADQHPELASEILSLFPTLEAMEELADNDSSDNGDRDPHIQQLPETIGGYRIVRRLGAGGMGVVYEAEQLSLARHVAIKVLPPKIANDRIALERFRREARAVARLQHENIVPIYEVGQDGTISFYVMQFVHGQPLEDVKSELIRLRSDSKISTGDGRDIKLQDSRPASASVRSLLSDAAEANRADVCDNVSPVPDSDTDSSRRQRDRDSSSANLPGREEISSVEKRIHHYFRSIAQLGLQAANALAYAHDEGVLHRDVKPSNLLLDAQGKVWLIDFGLAKIDGDELTESGDIVGTVRYMAPERFRGWSDPRSDVYGLGLTLYEMLTLQPAFQGRDRIELMHRITHTCPFRLRELDPRIPRDLQTIVETAIDREPSRRYQTCRAMSNDLERWLDGKPIHAKRNSWPWRTWQLCCRQPYLAASLATILLLLVAVSIGSTIAAINWRHLHIQSDQNAQRVRELSDEASERLVQSNLMLIRMTRNSGLPGQRFKTLELIRQTVSLATRPQELLQLRNDAIASLANVDVRPVKSWASPRNHAYVYFDSGFTHYGESDLQGNISIKMVATNRETIRLPGFGQSMWGYHFSANGKFFAAAYTGPPGVPWVSRIWDLEERKSIFEAQSGLRLSPDSQNFALIGPEGIEVRGLRDVDRVIPVLSKDSPLFHRDRNYFEFHPARPWLGVSNGTNQVHIFDLDEKAFVEAIQFPTIVGAPVWNSDGTLLMTAQTDIYIFDFQNRRTTTFKGHLGSVRQLDFHPGGRIFASVGINRWFWCTYSQRQLLRVSGFHQFSSDGSQVALGHREDGKYIIEICQIAIPQELRHVRIPRSSMAAAWDVASDATGEVVAIACNDGIRVVDVESLRMIEHLPGRAVSSLFFTTDSLIAVGQGGARRWKIVRRQGGISFEEPEVLVETNAYQSFASLTQNEKTLAVPLPTKTQIVDLETGRSKVVDTKSNSPLVAISPNGEWLATLGQYGDDSSVRVWSAKTAKPVSDLPARSGRMKLRFSPDGRFLVTSTVEVFQFWNTETWQLHHTIPRSSGLLAGTMEFSRDGKILAVAHTPFVVKLFDVNSLTEIATLEDPHAELFISSIRFTHDGSKLMVAREWGSVEIWDLALLQEQLQTLDLDWVADSESHSLTK